MDRERGGRIGGAYQVRKEQAEVVEEKYQEEEEVEEEENEEEQEVREGGGRWGDEEEYEQGHERLEITRHKALS